MWLSDHMDLATKPRFSWIFAHPPAPIEAPTKVSRIVTHESLGEDDIYLKCQWDSFLTTSDMGAVFERWHHYEVIYGSESRTATVQLYDTAISLHDIDKYRCKLDTTLVTKYLLSKESQVSDMRA